MSGSETANQAGQEDPKERPFKPRPFGPGDVVKLRSGPSSKCDMTVEEDLITKFKCIWIDGKGRMQAANIRPEALRMVRRFTANGELGTRTREEGGLVE